MRRETIGTQRQMLTNDLFGYLRSKNLSDMEDYLNRIDPILILELPNLVDMTDSGKSLVHKCAQIKSDLMLETLVEKYRKVYVEIRTDG